MDFEKIERKLQKFVDNNIHNKFTFIIFVIVVLVGYVILIPFNINYKLLKKCIINTIRKSRLAFVFFLITTLIICVVPLLCTAFSFNYNIGGKILTDTILIIFCFIFFCFFTRIIPYSSGRSLFYLTWLIFLFIIEWKIRDNLDFRFLRDNPSHITIGKIDDIYLVRTGTRINYLYRSIDGKRHVGSIYSTSDLNYNKGDTLLVIYCSLYPNIEYIFKHHPSREELDQYKSGPIEVPKEVFEDWAGINK